MLKFSDPPPTHTYNFEECCPTRSEFALTMWVKFEKYPAALADYKRGTDTEPNTVLRVLDNGELTFYYKGHNARYTSTSRYINEYRSGA